MLFFPTYRQSMQLCSSSALSVSTSYACQMRHAPWRGRYEGLSSQQHEPGCTIHVEHTAAYHNGGNKLNKTYHGHVLAISFVVVKTTSLYSVFLSLSAIHLQNVFIAPPHFFEKRRLIWSTESMPLQHNSKPFYLACRYIYYLFYGCWLEI